MLSNRETQIIIDMANNFSEALITLKDAIVALNERVQELENER
jgi:hypothetical protein